MTDDKRFTVVFRGRRDFYEVPLALAEVGALQSLVTDEYLPSMFGLTDWLAQRVPRVEARHRTGLDSRLVTCPMFWPLRGSLTDWEIGQRGAGAAAAANSIAVVYSYYLGGYLSADADGTSSPVVFQVHPTASSVRAAMVDCHPADSVVDPEIEELMTQTEVDDELGRLSVARAVLVGSKFTSSGVLEASVPATAIHPLMYGGDRARIGLNLDRKSPSAPRRLRLLYVGQISRRKGVGTLLTAMRQLVGAPVDLTIVTRDPRLGLFASDLELPNVHIQRVNDRELATVFENHDVLVLPSYIEGAGLVLSEALIAGLWILATPMSAAPELISKFGRGTLVEPGRPEELAEQITQLVSRGDELHASRLTAHANPSGAGPTWRDFRHELRMVLGVVPDPG